MTCLGVLERGERGDDYGTSLKEGGVIEMSTTVLHSRAAPSLCIYLPLLTQHFPGEFISIEHVAPHPMRTSCTSNTP